MVVQKCKYHPSGYCDVDAEYWDACPCYGCEYFCNSDDYRQEQEEY